MWAWLNRQQSWLVVERLPANAPELNPVEGPVTPANQQAATHKGTRPAHVLTHLAVRALFERLSPRSITLRFFSGFPDLDHAVRWATDVKDQHRYSLVATGADGRVATQAGVAVLSAEVLPRNHRMLHVLRGSGFPVTTHTIPGVVLVELATSRSPAALEQAPFCQKLPTSCRKVAWPRYWPADTLPRSNLALLIRYRARAISSR